MFEKESKEYAIGLTYPKFQDKQIANIVLRDVEGGFQKGAEFVYKANEWHNLNENCKDLPNEGEWVEGLYIWYYKGEPRWDVFKVRWYYEIGELDEKLVRWYSSDENNSYERDYWNKVDEPDYWRKITLPMRNEYDRNY